MEVTNKVFKRSVGRLKNSFLNVWLMATMQFTKEIEELYTAGGKRKIKLRMVVKQLQEGTLQKITNSYYSFGNCVFF